MVYTVGRPETVKLVITRADIHAGDHLGPPFTPEIPGDTTLAQLLAMNVPFVPEISGYTWVAEQLLDTPAAGRSEIVVLAVIADGRAGFVQWPDATLTELGLTRLHYTSAYRQDVDEAVAVLIAGGEVGTASVRPPLHQLRESVRWGLLDMTHYQADPRFRRRAQMLAHGLRNPEPDMATLLNFAATGAPPRLATSIRRWAALYDEPLGRLADYCSNWLYENGYYDRQRALEMSVTRYLPPPNEGWPNMPVYLGTDFATIRNVRNGDSRFFGNLSAVERLVT